MASNSYPAPLDHLLKLGDAWKMETWPDYLALGLGPEHVPDLIRMAIDPELNEADADGPEVWAPAHAWRALAQLHADEAAAPLTQLFRRIDENDDDFVGEDLPKAFGILGPGAIPALTAYLSGDTHGMWARVAAAHSLEYIGLYHPDARAACVAVVAGQLEHFSRQDPDLNGSLVANLVALKAVEAALVIEQAFGADQVDEMVVGDWEDVQVIFGLKPRREKPRRPPRPGSAAAALHQIVASLKQPRGKAAPKAEFEARAEQAVLAAQRGAAARPKRKHHRKRQGNG